MTNLPEIMPPKDVGIAIRLIDSNSNLVDLDALTDFRIKVLTNTLKVLSYWSKNEVEVDEEEENPIIWEQLTRISSTQYYGIISATLTHACKGQKVIFQITAELPTGEIISDEVNGFVFLRPNKTIDVLALPQNHASGLLMTDVIITFRTDHSVAAVTPTQALTPYIDSILTNLVAGVNTITHSLKRTPGFAQFFMSGKPNNMEWYPDPENLTTKIKVVSDANYNNVTIKLI